MSGPAAATQAADVTERRALRFASEADVIADVERLRASGYRRAGTWSLEQVAWHVAALIEMFLVTPTDPSVPPTREQAAMKAKFFRMLRSPHPHPTGTLKAPPGLEPPDACADADVDRLIAQLRRLAAYADPIVVMGPMGPVPIGECREAHLIHAAHHLSHLVPTRA